MPDGEEELKVLFPGTELKLGSETITVSPLKFRKWLKAAKLAKPMIEAFNNARIISFDKGKDDKGNDTLTYRMSESFGARLIALVADAEEPLIEFLAFAINKPIEWFDEIEGDEGLLLMETVFAENANFFAKRMMPIIQKLMGAASPSLPQETSPQDSSEPDTASTT